MVGRERIIEPRRDSSHYFPPCGGDTSAKHVKRGVGRGEELEIIYPSIEAQNATRGKA